MKLFWSILKKTISIMVIVCCIAIAYKVFSYSQNDDSFVHFLKERYSPDLIGEEPGFYGFSGEVTWVEENMTAKYGGYPVIFYSLEYQRYQCNDDDCYWRTYDTKLYPASFKVRSGDKEVMFEKDMVLYTPTYFVSDYEIMEETYHKKRTLQYILRSDMPVTIWGEINEGHIDGYLDTQHRKEVFVITSEPRLFLERKISFILWIQIGSCAIILAMIVLLYLINRDYSEKSYTISSKQRF